jgi:hypothetical protein
MRNLGIPGNGEALPKTSRVSLLSNDWQLGRPTQAEIDAFWQKKLDRQPATPRGVAVRPFYIRYENGRRSVEDVYGPFLYENRRKPGAGAILVLDLTHRSFFAVSFYEARREQSPELLSITTYRRIHATGFYLNRLFRLLHNEEPTTPLLREARADAERRYGEFCQGRVRRYQRRVERLNPISIRASKLKKPTDPLSERDYDRLFKRLQEPVNDEIWLAVRRVEKTKACREMYGQLAVQRQLRRIFEIDVARLDRVLKQITPKDDLVVPRGWPMQNRRGVYVPLLGPPKARKTPKPSMDEQEKAGKKADWARLKIDMGVPLDREDRRAREKEDNASKAIETLVWRQNRKPTRLRTFTDLRSGQIWANYGILKVGTGK